MNSATDMLYKYNLQILGEIRKGGPIGHVLHNQRHFFMNPPMRLPSLLD